MLQKSWRCDGKAIVIIEVGDGMYFVGEGRVDTITDTTDTYDYFDRGRFIAQAVGERTVDLDIRCTGSPVITDKKPVLADEASILELVRIINKRIKERDAHT
jgi:hypothetical protein